MTFVPSPFLVRLQELKLWQGNYDLSQQNKSKNDTNPADYESIEGLSALDSTVENDKSSEKPESIEWDKKAISPSKPFEQLLEEKLAEEDVPPKIEPKPKKPYLKKGQGLKRFQLKAGQARRNQPPSTAYTSYSKITKKTRVSPKQKKVLDTVEEGASVENTATEANAITPLKMPEFIMHPKARWIQVTEDGDTTPSPSSKSSRGNSPKKTRFSKESLKEEASHFNSHILNKLNELSLTHFLPRKDNLITRKSSEVNGAGEQTIFEQETERELRLFEILEEKAQNSSFCSTNTSIMNLMSSTPNKLKNYIKKAARCKERTLEIEDGYMDFPNGDGDQSSSNVQKKLQAVTKKTEVLQNFLQNLQRLHFNEKQCSGSTSSEDTQVGLDSSFSDDEKWSSDNMTASPNGSSSNLTDKNEHFHEKRHRRETSADRTLSVDKCENCEILEEQLLRLSKQMPDIQAEKARVMDFVKELEVKRDQLLKEMQNIKKEHEREVSRLKEEFDVERKKFAKEKMYFESYVKDSQNRPSKKDREEISSLKKELADIKELVKMKEAKNGASQARLRTQIRQLEKERDELKTEVEKLQRDNAKLAASQRLYRRPAEAKMLHEINKNLSKLTEETLKKQLNRSDGDHETTANFVQPTKPHIKDKFKPRLVTTVADTLERSKGDVKDSPKADPTDISVEKQYQNVFGKFSSPRGSGANSNIHEKQQTVFEDGSIMIKYSNGNEKIISPDGSVVRITYYNGDMKETNLKEKTIRYFYFENSTWHTQFEDGTELLEHPDGQKCKKYPDGKIEVTYPDGAFRTINPDGTEQAQYPDGSQTLKNAAGEIVILLPNGQREVHTKDHKRREYPDGTVRKLYEDGRIETRYPNGRVRIKDPNGVLVVDTFESSAN